MSVDDVPDLEPAAGEVLLAPEAVGICGSELEGYLGHQANRTPPLVMGHEFAGRVVELGAGVDERWRGRSVAVNPLIAGARFIAGIEQLSDQRQLIGVHRPGGFAGAVASPSTACASCPMAPTPGSARSPSRSPTASTPRASASRASRPARPTASSCSAPGRSG